MITLRFDNGGMSVSLAQAPQVMGVQLQKWLTLVLAHLHAAVARNIAQGGLIGRRTGNLARALQSLVTFTDHGITGELWPDPDKAPYGSIQEEGGTIVPKHGRALTIPLEAMLTGNGVAKATARQVRETPTAFGFSGTFVAKSVIFGKQLGTWKRGQYTQPIIPLFALKPSVTIPGRHYLAITLVQEWPWISDLLEQVAGDAVHVLFGEGAFSA